MKLVFRKYMEFEHSLGNTKRVVALKERVEEYLKKTFPQEKQSSESEASEKSEDSNSDAESGSEESDDDSQSDEEQWINT